MTLRYKSEVRTFSLFTILSECLCVSILFHGTDNRATLTVDGAKQMRPLRLHPTHVKGNLPSTAERIPFFERLSFVGVRGIGSTSRAVLFLLSQR
jgi:hypothetical protein